MHLATEVLKPSLTSQPSHGPNGPRLLKSMTIEDCQDSKENHWGTVYGVTRIEQVQQPHVSVESCANWHTSSCCWVWRLFLVSKISSLIHYIYFHWIYTKSLLTNQMGAILNLHVWSHTIEFPAFKLALPSATLSFLHISSLLLSTMVCKTEQFVNVWGKAKSGLTTHKKSKWRSLALFDGGKGRFTIFVEALQGAFKPANNILGVNFVIAKFNTGLCFQKSAAYKQALLGGCLTICWCCASCRSSWRCTWFAKFQLKGKGRRWGHSFRKKNRLETKLPIIQRYSFNSPVQEYLADASTLPLNFPENFDSNCVLSISDHLSKSCLCEWKPMAKVHMTW